MCFCEEFLCPQHPQNQISRAIPFPSPSHAIPIPKNHTKKHQIRPDQIQPNAPPIPKIALASIHHAPRTHTHTRPHPPIPHPGSLFFARCTPPQISPHTSTMTRMVPRFHTSRVGLTSLGKKKKSCHYCCNNNDNNNEMIYVHAYICSLAAT